MTRECATFLARTRKKLRFIFLILSLTAVTTLKTVDTRRPRDKNHVRIFWVHFRQERKPGAPRRFNGINERERND